VGVTLVDDALARHVKPGDQGTTFGAGPLACAAILATQHIVRAESLVARARDLEARVREGFHGEVRGHGGLLGLVHDTPVKPLVAELRQRGFIVGGSDDPRVMRLMPPLNVPFEAVDALLATLRSLG